MAVIGTQIVATLIAVYGLFMTPLGWGWAGFVWGYALVWFLLNDRLKLLMYRIFDHIKVGENPDTKVEPRPEAKPDDTTSPRSEAKAELKPKAEVEVKPDPKSESTKDTKAAECRSEAGTITVPEAKTETATDAEPAPKPRVNVTAQAVQ